MILCIDLETTGLDEQRCGLVEIGACWLHSGESFFRACKPNDANCRIEDEALRVNGVNREQLFTPERRIERVAIVELLGWARGAMSENGKVQIAAWNAHFDHRHLQASLDRAGVPGSDRIFGHRLIDVHSALAVDLMRKTGAGPWPTKEEMIAFGMEVPNSDSASALLGLPEETKPHNALNGARQVRAMLRRLLGDSGALP